jgi:hypothetical protein
MSSVTAMAGSQASIQFPTVKEYVVAHGGDSVIEKILIANNGLSAVKGRFLDLGCTIVSFLF